MIIMIEVLLILIAIISLIVIGVNKIEKNPKRIKMICLVNCFVIAIACMGCGEEERIESDKVTVNSENPVQDTQHKEKLEQVEYDKLQKLFLDVNISTVENELLSIIEENGLEYSVQEYNGTPKKITYKIAFAKGVVAQKHADTGDYVEVSFDEGNGTLLFMRYYSSEHMKEVLLYNYGTYWDFNEKEPDNQYTGYYYHILGINEGGITIHYDNGNNSETGYFDVDTGEAALKNILVNE